MPTLTGMLGTTGNTIQPHPGGKPRNHQPRPATGSSTNHALISVPELYSSRSTWRAKFWRAKLLCRVCVLWCCCDHPHPEHLPVTHFDVVFAHEIEPAVGADPEQRQAGWHRADGAAVPHG